MLVFILPVFRPYLFCSGQVELGFLTKVEDLAFIPGKSLFTQSLIIQRLNSKFETPCAKAVLAQAVLLAAESISLLKPLPQFPCHFPPSVTSASSDVLHLGVMEPGTDSSCIVCYCVFIISANTYWTLPHSMPSPWI